MGKTVTASTFSEWRGLDHLRCMVHALRCIYIEMTKDDVGVDAEIGGVVAKTSGKEGYETVGGIVNVQAKSGESDVVRDGPESFATPVDRNDLLTWKSSTFPIIFIERREIHENETGDRRRGSSAQT